MNPNRSLTFVTGAFLSILLAAAAPAATFNIANGDVAGLISAINTANGNNEADTIVLATDGVYTFTTPHSGADGLPVITPDAGHALKIEGSGAAMTYSGTGDLRFFHNSGFSSVAIISNLTMSGGKASSLSEGGGAVYNALGTLTVDNCVFDNNSVIDGSGVTDPEEGGGAIFNENGGRLTVQNCSFSGNTACSKAGVGTIHSGGGAICNTNALATVINCVFAGNQAKGCFSNARSNGGAILNTRNDASMTIIDCTFSDNVATHSGGGIHNQGDGVLTVSSCTFRSNSAADSYLNAGEGGAIGTIGTCDLTNSTFSANEAANDNGVGGAISNYGPSGGTGATLTVTSCTFSGDRASLGGAIYNHSFGQGSATVVLRNTLLKEASSTNLVNDGPNSVISSEGYNLSSDNGGGFLTGSGDQINTDPKLDPLGLRDNGGPTQTIALVQGSLALDHGKNFSSLTTDQRGQPRTYDHPYVNNGPGTDGTDIGALEAFDVLQAGTPNYNVNMLADHDDGTCGIIDCTLREAINRANAISGVNTILFLVGGTITLDYTLGPLTVTGPTTLAGFGARATTISGGYATPVFRFSGGPSFLIGMTIRDGRSFLSLMISNAPSSGSAITATGAGLLNTGELTVNVCTFINNSATAGNGASAGEAGGIAQGGGVFNGGSGKLTFNRCTFAANSATGGQGANSFSDFAFGGAGGAAEGAALFNELGGRLTLNNCTLAGNTATGGAGGNNTGPNGFGGNGGAGEGAGMFNRGTLTLTATTVANNTGVGGAGGLGNTTPNNGASGAASGGIQRTAGTATIRNSIAATNTGNNGPDAVGAFVSQGYNLIGNGDTSSGFTATGDMKGTTGAPLNPNLGPLQDNGGPTDTLALLDFSPAIDAGHSFGQISDQRGQPRPNDHPFFPNAPGGDGADIGAFEFGAVLLVNTLDDHNDGACDPFDCSLREAIIAANAEVGDQFIKFVPGLEGTIQLNSALPDVTATAFLQGPGADRLTVRRNTGGDYRIFTISNGTSNGPFVSISGLTIANGKVGSDTVLEPGGGILVDRGVLELQGCALVGNQAASHGGGVFITERSVSEPSLIETCTFSGNTTTGGQGGGLCITSAAALVVSSTFSGNNSNFYGGAMFAGLAGPSGAPPELGVDSSTLSGNHATNSGGGISKASVGRVMIMNNIFNNNGGGSLHTFGEAPISQGHNLSSDAGGGYLTATGDMVDTDPMLGPLQNNGGPTFTHALFSGSPAIDQGSDHRLNTDQRGDGYPRIIDISSIANAADGSDIGAFEFGAGLTAVSRKIHGATAFDVPLPLTGTPGIECRRNTGADATGPNAGRDHQVVITFPSVVTVGATSVTSNEATDTPSATFSVTDNVVTIDLHNIASAPRRLMISLHSAEGGQTIASFPIGILAADSTGDGFVNSADISQTKSKSGQAVDATNFRQDVTVDGFLNSADISFVKSKSGTALP